MTGRGSQDSFGVKVNDDLDAHGGKIVASNVSPLQVQRTQTGNANNLSGIPPVGGSSNQGVLNATLRAPNPRIPEPDDTRPNHDDYRPTGTMYNAGAAFGSSSPTAKKSEDAGNIRDGPGAVAKDGVEKHNNARTANTRNTMRQPDGSGNKVAPDQPAQPPAAMSSKPLDSDVNDDLDALGGKGVTSNVSPLQVQRTQTGDANNQSGTHPAGGSSNQGVLNATLRAPNPRIPEPDDTSPDRDDNRSTGTMYNAGAAFGSSSPTAKKSEDAGNIRDGPGAVAKDGVEKHNNARTANTRNAMRQPDGSGYKGAPDQQAQPLAAMSSEPLDSDAQNDHDNGVVNRQQQQQPIQPPLDIKEQFRQCQDGACKLTTCGAADEEVTQQLQRILCLCDVDKKLSAKHCAEIKSLHTRFNAINIKHPYPTTPAQGSAAASTALAVEVIEQKLQVLQEAPMLTRKVPTAFRTAIGNLTSDVLTAMEYHLRSQSSRTAAAAVKALLSTNGQLQKSARQLLEVLQGTRYVMKATDDGVQFQSDIKVSMSALEKTATAGKSSQRQSEDQKELTEQASNMFSLLKVVVQGDKGKAEE
ncbi:hypothetical protein RI367_007229 [Sorochytrium milnesiophthora]